MLNVALVIFVPISREIALIASHKLMEPHSGLHQNNYLAAQHCLD
jgi:hypothetical protein